MWTYLSALAELSKNHFRGFSFDKDGLERARQVGLGIRENRFFLPCDSSTAPPGEHEVAFHPF